MTIEELILGVNISLGLQPVSACPAFDCDNTGSVGINCLVQGVNNSLVGCSPSACPLAAGKYTVTQVEGSTLRIGNLSPMEFPSGGTLVLDVGPASPPACVHDVVLKSPGGFSSPAFCISAFGFTVGLTQTGCGIGQIDSNGGADYTITELGDTSSQPECENQQECVDGTDSRVRVDITVGDGTADTCSSGTASGIITVPVETLSWIDMSVPLECPSADGMYNPETDQLILAVQQILDFTTDTNAASWSDLSGDGCAIAGVGPDFGFSNTGTCWDIDAGTIGLASSGTVGSDAATLFDLSFGTLLPNTVSARQPLEGATCESPPAINFDGTAIRCLE